MSAVYEASHTVTEAEIDLQGHAGNEVYLKWMLAAAIGHSTVQGWSHERYRRQGAIWVVRSHHIEYLQPAFLGDEIVVRTWVADMKKITSLRKYRIVRSRDDATLVVAETNWAYVDLNLRKPRRIPPELAESFTVVAESV